MSRTELKHQINMKIAEARSELSTCQFTKVGAVIVDPNNQIVSSGYNGTISGAKHCTEVEMTRDEHVDFSNKYEVHAEVNAVSNAAKAGKSTDGCVAYVTLTPCWNCAKTLKSAGIDKVFYKTKYWRMDQSEIDHMSDELNLILEQLT